jgi:hypothetical protein
LLFLPARSAALLLRSVILLALLLGPSGQVRMPEDSALRFAMVAGALCQGDPAGTVPGAGHAHDQCVACQIGGAAGWLTQAPNAARMEGAASTLPVMMSRVAAWQGAKAHRARAPPPVVG